MGFLGVYAVAAAEESGNVLYRTFRKQPTQGAGSGVWFDLSVSPGNPAPQYYIGSSNVFTPLKQSTDGGIPHPLPCSPQKQFLRKLMVMTVTAAAVPLPMILMDYVGFYGFIDESSLDEQFMDNTTPLPRYVDGRGLQLMAVVVAGQTGGQPFTVKYTNQDGVANRVTSAVTMNTRALTGTIISTLSAGAGYYGPFLPLQSGDSGVRSVQSVTIGGAGDVGLFALALVKPLATTALRGIDAPTEVDFLKDFAAMPEIKDDAYLGFICHPTGSLSGAPIHGEIYTAWG